MKLSEAQRRLLQALAGGATVQRIGGINPQQNLSTTRAHVSWSTTNVLEREKLIERFYPAPHSLDKDYRITPAGLRALQGGKDG